MKPETEKKLLDFIESQRESDIAGTLRHVVDRLGEHEKQDQDRHEAIVGEIKSISFRVSTLEQVRANHSIRVRHNEEAIAETKQEVVHELDKLQDKIEVTGSYQRDDLVKKVSWWRENVAKVIFGISSALGGVALAKLIERLLK